VPNPTLGADGVFYAGSRPVDSGQGRWRRGTAWVGRALGAAFRWVGRTGQRAITSLPWASGGPRGSVVSANQAISLIPLFGCVRILADGVASLPLQTYKQLGDRRERQSFVPPLLWQPSAQDNLFEWLHKCVVSMALRGNAYGLIVARDDMEFPTQIEWMNPDDVFVDELNPQAPVYYWQGHRLPNEDVFHIPWFVMPGKVVGLSPVSAFASTIGVGISATDYGRSWFDNGGTPPAVFKNAMKTVNPAESEEISDRLASRMRSRKPLVHGNDWTFTPMQVNPEESQFIETMKLNATQIAAIFGIPPEDVGGEPGGSLTYTTVEMNQLKLATQTLRPWLVRLETALSLLMPVRQYVKFNIDAMIRTDLKTRYEAHQIAINSGWRNVDETRAIEDEAPLPNGQGQAYKPISAPPMNNSPASDPPPEPRRIPGKQLELDVGGLNGQADPTGKQGVNGVRH
jgi:HK97 family phage portal protein